MKHILLLIIFLMGLMGLGCFTERKAANQLNRIKTRFPDLIQVKIENVPRTRLLAVMTPSVSHDTTVTLKADTTTIETDRFRTTITRTDTVFKIRTILKPYTDTVTVRDTVQTVRTELVTAVKKVVPTWAWVAFYFLGAIILFLTFKIIFK